MFQENTIEWLLGGDISIQYQVYRDLFGKKMPRLRGQIAKQGWGKQFLDKQNKDGHWGKNFYQPKWISTHYTLLDLKNIGISQNISAARKSIVLVLENEFGPDGGILPIGKEQSCDVCVNGMFINYATYFRTDQNRLKSIIDFILDQKMPDGGFNCLLNSVGAKHSSLHSTISVLEGISEYIQQGYKYRIRYLKKAKKEAEEFVLMHRLFLSDHTGKVIKKDFLKLNYPDRWKYNILRSLDYFQKSDHKYDERMSFAIEYLLKKRRKDGKWNVQAHHPGKKHFQMEKPGSASRWNTLRAARVLRHFNIKV